MSFLLVVQYFFTDKSQFLTSSSRSHDKLMQRFTGDRIANLTIEHFENRFIKNVLGGLYILNNDNINCLELIIYLDFIFLYFEVYLIINI